MSKSLVLFTETPAWRKAVAAAFGQPKQAADHQDTERRIANAAARIFRAYADAVKRPLTEEERDDLRSW